MHPYAERREKALAAFGEGVAIVPSARTTLRNGDSSYAFRQDSDFFYLTGFNEPDAVLVLANQGSDARSVLFLRERNRDLEVWTGARLGVDDAASTLAVDRAYPIDELEKRLPDLLVGAPTLHYAFGNNERLDRIVRNSLETARERTRRGGRSPYIVAEPSATLHPMRLRKSDDELDTLRKACEITRAGHLAGMRATRPGAYEYTVQAAIENEYRRLGAEGLAYESIVASGDNATVLHYVRNRDRLQSGQLLLVDSGCEFDCYATDVTRTWPVDGRFSPEQRALYEIVLAAQEAAIDRVRPGIGRNEFHDTAVRVIVEGLIDAGILRGSVDENVASEAYREYYMHGTGHWLGLDVHDAGAYRERDDSPLQLQPGMITTVEPGIYVRRDSDAPDRFKGIGIRIEDDILVTVDGNENLTAALPKAIDDIESLIGDRTMAA